MKFACYTDWDQLPGSADALFAQAERDSVFFSRAWFECLSAQALDKDHSLLLACVVDGDTVLAVLPLLQSAGSNTWYALRHGYTPIYSLLLAEHDRPQILACLANALYELPLNGLLLEPVAADDERVSALQRALEAAGFHCEQRFRSYNWITRLNGQSFAQYLAERPAQLRNTIARKRRKLEREHGLDIRLFSGEQVPDAMADYYVAYDASWKQSEPGNAAFQDCFVAAFSRPGWTRLAILYIKGRPVAGQLWFVRHNRASIFRLAYDKAWRQYSPGSILTSTLAEHVIDIDRVEEIDFLTGNDAYKQDWMSVRRERFLLSCVRDTRPASRVQRVIASLQRLLKRR